MKPFDIFDFFVLCLMIVEIDRIRLRLEDVQGQIMLRSSWNEGIR